MHVHRSLLAAVARGELPRQILDEIQSEHLTTVCPVCEAEIHAHQSGRWRLGGWSASEVRDPVERLRRRLGLTEVELRVHEERARRWVRKIVRLAPGKRRGVVRGAYSRYRGSLFGLLLLEEARRRIPAEPAECLSLAEAVLVSCEHGALYRPDPEVQAPALAVRGNAKRALGRLREADQDLADARRLLDSPGMTDPATPAEVYSYLGSLRRDQGRFQEASDCLERAARIYDLLGDTEKAARVLLKLGTVHFRRHELDAAVAAVDQALELLAHDAPIWLHAYARFNRMWYLHGRGDLDGAEAELATHSDLLAAAGEEVLQHVTWLRGRIARSRGDLRTSQRLFSEARAGLLAREKNLDAGLVSLELALVHLVQGRTPRAKKCALETLQVFAAQKVEREASAALEVLAAAARRDALTRELLERSIAALESVRHARPAARQP